VIACHDSDREALTRARAYLDNSSVRHCDGAVRSGSGVEAITRASLQPTKEIVPVR
jgi:hypothetical protein